MKVKHQVTIVPCYGSYEQYGAEIEILRHTGKLAEAMAPFFGEDEEK